VQSITSRGRGIRRRDTDRASALASKHLYGLHVLMKQLFKTISGLDGEVDYSSAIDGRIVGVRSSAVEVQPRRINSPVRS